MRYRSDAFTDALKKRETEWMNELRTQAGLPAGWTPPDEARNEDARNG
jgi:hypothetical protein